jgi:sugar transferase (PEP-CTERM/EpsH1 system associated)
VESIGAGNKMRIGHVVLSLAPGGLENGVVNVINGLDPARFSSSVYCLRERGAFADRLGSNLSNLENLGFSGGFSLPKLLKLARLFKRDHIDVIHTRNAESLLYGYCASRLLRGVPIVHSEHGQTFPEIGIRAHWHRVLAKRSDEMFCVSMTLRADLERYLGIPSEHSRVIYNGVESQQFAKVSLAVGRTAIGAENGDMVIGCVGRMVAVKNYGLLLESFAGIPDDRVKLVLVGDGPEREGLIALSRELGISHRTRFLGHREDVATVLSGMNIFVLPSLSEGLSNTLLEAMSAGLPVIATDVGGNSEILTADVEGILIRSGDHLALTNALIRLISDPPLRLGFGQAGRERCQRQFGMQNMIDSYADLYSSTAVRGRKHTL